MNERLTDEELRATVVAALRGQPDTVWKRFTHEHGIYEITRLNVSTELVCRAIESAVLARAAVPAVQPQEPLTNQGVLDACLSYRHDFGLLDSAAQTRLMSDCIEWALVLGVGVRVEAIKAVTAALQAEARQKPDSSYSAQPKGEEATARALADGYVGGACSVIGAATTATVTLHYTNGDKAEAAFDAITAAIDAALSSTPAQVDGELEVPRG